MSRGNYNIPIGESLDKSNLNSLLDSAKNLLQEHESGGGRMVDLTEGLINHLGKEKINFNSQILDTIDKLYDRCSASDKAEIIGKLITVEQNSGLLLDKLGHGKDILSTLFDKAESKKIHDSLSKTVEDRLQLLASILEKDSGQNNSAPENRETTGHSAAAVLTEVPNRKRPELPHVDSNADTGPDPESLIKIINDTELPEEKRLEACHELGSGSFKLLFDLIGKSDRDTEFARSALIHLGSNPIYKREIFQGLKKLNCSPEHRKDVEFIERALIDSGPNKSPSINSYSTDNDNKQVLVKDGWLMRAIASCDSPNILMAARGREAIAIQLVVKKIAEVRQKRK